MGRVVLLCLLLTGCIEPHYKWQLVGLPSSKVVWEVVSWEDVQKICGWSGSQFTKTVACAVQIRESDTCFIHSYLTPDQAKVSWDLDGTSIYEHEMKHCQGWRH